MPVPNTSSPASPAAQPPGQATLLSLSGMFSIDGSPIVPASDLQVVERLPRYPGSPFKAQVLDDTDALGQALQPRGGLATGQWSVHGTASLVLRYGKESLSSRAVPLSLRLLRPKQLVLLTFLPSYQESLRLFGLRAIDRAVRARVLDVARRDYAGLAVEFREVEPDAAPPTDFAHYALVEVGERSQWAGYLGYDNTPARSDNARLYDRIGGVNAVTQSDGSPGYGGVFAEQLLGFSTHPGRVEKIKIPRKMRSSSTPSSTRCGKTRGQAADLSEVAGLLRSAMAPSVRRFTSDRSRVIACRHAGAGQSDRYDDDPRAGPLAGPRQPQQQVRQLPQQRQPRRSHHESRRPAQLSANGPS